LSIGLDPLISNIFFTLNLIPHFGKIEKLDMNVKQKSSLELPFVSVIVALYREKFEDINMTASSLAAQSYPPNCFEVLFPIESDDWEVLNRVQTCIKRLIDLGIDARVIIIEGCIHTKPNALNQAIKHAKGEYCIFYDASDIIDHDQIERGISLMLEKELDVAQARVLRKGNSILSHFLLLDTVIWFWKYIPLLLKFCGGFPLSGEGLFIKKSVLNEVNNFPEVLTEDAYLGMILSQKNKHFGLIDSNIVEKAPRNMMAHIKQKMRWHRGYLTCLWKLIFTNMPFRKKISFFLPFCTPIASGLAFVGWLFLIFNFIAPNLEINFSWMDSVIYKNILYSWSFFLAYIGIPLSIASTIYVAFSNRMLQYAPLAIILPFYWIFVGFCSICSYFRGTTDWGKTER